MPAPPWKRLVQDLTGAGYESPYLERLRRRVDVEQAHTDLENEIVAEMAAALGRAEAKVDAALLRLELAGRDVETSPPGTPREEALTQWEARRIEALAARHDLLIHREAVGFRRNAMLETLYPIPDKRR